MKTRTLAAALALPLMIWNAGAAAGDRNVEQSTLERGRYLVQIGACNDCHTPNYLETDGRVPEREWLTGLSTGFQGPWGTTYPPNLRLKLRDLTEAQWLERARTAMRPPMPWFNLRDMSDDDLRALYRYVRSLPPAGQPAPAFVPPGQPVSTPFYVFVPQNVPKQAAAR
ncbi:MAG TPA: c-type cytochrome [Pelomicrobium sp.]|nr:c-type cytochrome [Pelomicrobium sp.]